MFAKMNLFLPLGVKYWPVLVKTFAGVFMFRKQSPHLMARILTNLLQKARAIVWHLKNNCKKSLFSFKSNEIVNKESYVSDR